MKFSKRIIGTALCAALITGLFPTSALSASAKEKSSVIYDYNGDNVSDDSDIEQLTELNKKYHAPIVQDMLYGALSSTDYDTAKADSIPRYFLTNLNQCTTPRLQEPLGDCWAQTAVGMLESSALKAKSRLKNPSGDIDSKAFDEPVLSGLKNTECYSPKAAAWFLGEALKADENPSQAGEGYIYPDNSNDRFTIGGFNSYCETLFSAWRSVFTEAQYPHVPNDWDGTISYITETKSWCLPEDASAKSFDKAPRLTDCMFLPNTSVFENNANQNEWKSYDKNARSIIKQAVLDYGAVNTSYNSDGDNISSTIYSNKSFNGTGHAALIVGWDDNFSKDNYVGKSKAAPPEDGAWLVKNTFGSYDYMNSHFKNWDVDREGIMGMTYAETQDYYKERNTSLEEMKKLNPNIQNKYTYECGIRDSEDRGTGFFWIYYCDRTLGAHCVYNVDIADDGYDYDNNYQYDYAVSNDDLRLSLRTGDTGTLVSNVFTANGNEELRAFSTYTNATDSVVKTDIYLLDGSESNPTEGKLACSSEDNIKFAGFHTIKLSKGINLPQGQKFAIVQNIKSYDKGSDAEVSFLNLETTIDSEKISVGPAQNKVVCNEGETFVRLDGNWTTPKELNENLEIAQLFEFGNAKIKAFTVNEGREPATVEPTETNSETIPRETEQIDSIPVVTEPAQTTSDVTEPITTEPVATEPITTEPVATQPVATEPIATEPIDTQPVTAEPTEPAVTEPQPTTPEPTTPSFNPTQPSIPEPTLPKLTVKKANPIKVTVKKKTVKLKKLKKKAQKVKAITVKNAQGKVTFKLVKSGIAKKIRKLVKINSNGVITIKKWKKAKKGTYKIKVKITAAGNINYNAKTITKTVKVKIK
jgi:C1A family cysteine protease